MLPLVLALAACSAGRARRDPVARALREADRQHARREDPAAREAALQRYLGLLERSPDDHRVLARVTRALVVQGMASPDAARGSWQAAREYGLRCMMVGWAFAARVGATGGRVTPAAVKRLSPEHGACAVWTAEAWGRQSALRGGAGVALDLPVVQALAARGAEEPGRLADDSQSQGTLGLALALTPEALRSPGTQEQPDEQARARVAFAAAIEADPGRLLPRVDLVEFVLLPAGELGAARAMLAAVRDAPVPVEGDIPEAAWARLRAEALLSQM